MRFIHTADWHLTAGKSYIPNAVQRQLDCIDEIYKLAEREGITTVVMAGDVFDSPNLTDTEKRQLNSKLLNYDTAGFCTLMIPGNHDKIASKLSTLNSLDLLTKHERFKHSHVAECTELVVVAGWGFLLFAGEPWDRLAEHVVDIMEGSLSPDIKGLIVVAHIPVQGSVLDTGFTMEEGVTINPNNHVTYYALGDIHAQQRVAPRTYYCGSPLQINFGEIPPNGVLIVDTDEPDNPTFVELPSVKLVTIKDPHEAIPPDCLARLIYQKPPTADVEVPAGVIKTVWVAPKVDLSVVSLTGKLFDGIENLLQQRGLKDKDLELAKSELEEAKIVVGGTHE